MKKFQYRLEVLLKVKKELEKLKQKELAEVHRKIIRQNEKLSALEQERAAVVSHQREEQSAKITIADMLAYSRYYMKLKRQKISDAEMLRILNLDFEKKRAALLAASIERKKFDRLKELQQLKHLAEVHKQDSKLADEFGRISHANKSHH